MGLMCFTQQPRLRCCFEEKRQCLEKPCIVMINCCRISSWSLKIANQSDVIVGTWNQQKWVGKAVAERILKFTSTERLIARIIKTETCSVSLFTGRPLVLVQENETVPAILNTWFAGRSWERHCRCLVWWKILW
jgi:hypothetical protein